MIAVPPATAVELALARLERWLETMRGPGGYGGPVAHWWRDCLLFSGAGLDWRYEGIIAGYLALFERSGERRWLEKARRAGEDLVQGQLASGCYRNSRFELNPGVGGTPHEAAADIGLLLLARALRAAGEQGWERYLAAAERNLRGHYLGRLWCEAEGRFRDDPTQPSFVPNKSATLIEALCLLAELTRGEEYLERYVRPTAEAILTHQVRAAGNRLDGAIAQNTLGTTVVEKYFPYYIARCVPGLLAAHRHLGEPRYLEAALRAATFVFRWREPDGGFPQVVYADGRVNRFPRWVAGVGDVLRALEMVRPYGLHCDLEPTRAWLLAGQLPGGSFRVARGFGAQVHQRQEEGPPDARDLLPVAGWNDKAFRYLAGQVERVPGAAAAPVREPCTWQGRPAEFHEDEAVVEVTLRGRGGYRWRKGEPWAALVERG